MVSALVLVAVVLGVGRLWGNWARKEQNKKMRTKKSCYLKTKYYA